jgi:prepilin peptidase CpaA
VIEFSDGCFDPENAAAFPSGSTSGCLVERMLKQGVWMLATIPAVAAGWTDWRSRRIPNWLTVPAMLFGIAANSLALGWAGTKASLLGAALGLGLVLPLVLLKSLGGGDWKLVGALGAFLGPSRLLDVLVVSVLVAGAMAVALIIWKRQIGRTLRNLLHLVVSLFTLHVPPPELSLDNPDSLKVPFGLALAVGVVLYTVRQSWGLL